MIEKENLIVKLSKEKIIHFAKKMSNLYEKKIQKTYTHSTDIINLRCNNGCDSTPKIHGIKKLERVHFNSCGKLTPYSCNIFCIQKKGET